MLRPPRAAERSAKSPAHLSRTRLVGTLATIGSITEDRALSDAEKVTRIRVLLAQRETRRLLEEEEEDPVAELKASLVSELDEDDYPAESPQGADSRLCFREDAD